MESFVEGLARWQAARGWTVSVVSLRAPGLPDRALRPGGHTVRRLSRVGPRRYPFAWGLGAAVRGADLVHVHGVDGLADQVLGLPGRPPVGVSTHGGFLHTPRQAWLKALWLRTLTRASLARAEAIWFTSETDAARLAPGLPRGTVVPDGLDLSALLALPRRPEPGRWLVFGRVDVHKGHLDVLRALARPEAPQDVILHVVGRSADRAWAAHLQARTRALGLSRRVHWHGEVPRDVLHHHLSRAAAVLAPSEREGFGLAVVEAQAAGIGPWARPIPAHRALVRAGETGHLVRWSVPGEAAATLSRLHRRPPLDPATVRRAARVHDWSVVGPRWDRAYDAVWEAACG